MILIVPNDGCMYRTIYNNIIKATRMKKTGLAELMEWIEENRVIIDSDDIISKGEELLEKESSDILQRISYSDLLRGLESFKKFDFEKTMSNGWILTENGKNTILHRADNQEELMHYVVCHYS